MGNPAPQLRAERRVTRAGSLRLLGRVFWKQSWQRVPELSLVPNFLSPQLSLPKPALEHDLPKYEKPCGP